MARARRLAYVKRYTRGNSNSGTPERQRGRESSRAMLRLAITFTFAIFLAYRARSP